MPNKENLRKTTDTLRSLLWSPVKFVTTSNAMNAMLLYLYPFVCIRMHVTIHIPIIGFTPLVGKKSITSACKAGRTKLYVTRCGFETCFVIMEMHSRHFLDQKDSHTAFRLE